MAVIGYHFFPAWIKGGFVGVDVFFVISGFLIGGILLEALRKGEFSLTEFYARRIRRIFPALILVLLSVLAFGWFALWPEDYQNLGKHTAGGAAFISNFLFWQEAGYFDVAAERKPLLHLWSLGVEEQFYIVFPISLWLLWRMKLRILAGIALFAFVSFVLNFAVYRSYPDFDFYFPLTRFWELLAGAVLWLVLRDENMQFARLPFKLNARLSSNFLSGLGMALLTIAMVNTSTEHFPGIKALIPVVGTLCLIAAGSGAWLNRKLFSWRPVVGIGLISYPLYLWHWPLLAYGYIMAGETLPPRGYRIAMVFIALALATLTYWAVERPIRFGKNARKLKMIALIAFMITLGITGGIVYQQKVKNLPENYRDILFRDEACDVIADGYCKYHDAKGKATVLVVGDSHAAMAYERIAIHNEKNGVNTLLLGHSIEFNPVNGKLANLDYVSRLFYAVQSDTKIKKVFIFTRGMYYIDSRGKEFFVQKTQASIDNLLQMGKEVYLVADNPDLPFNIRSIFSIQPLLLMNRKKAALYKTGVLTHQKVYLQALQELKGAKILYTLDAFCPENECLLFNENGLPLYYDYNHISIHAGGEFLVQRVLAPYLDE